MKGLILKFSDLTPTCQPLASQKENPDTNINRVAEWYTSAMG